MSGGTIRNTTELQRILALPRRVFSKEDGTRLSNELTALLRRDDRCNGTEDAKGLCTVCRQPMRLKPVQALALHDIALMRGGFLPIGVGQGKTLISLLAPFVLDAKKPLLLLPASLVEKTKRERAKLEKHWLIPTSIRVFSYEMLGRAKAADELETFKHDAFILDEAHRVKNHRAAVSKRLARWMRNNPDTLFVGMSGTMMRTSLHDFAHILRWGLKDGAPVPKTEHEVDAWATALDEPKSTVEELERPDPGALELLCSTPNPSIEDVRRGFRARLIETPGVVSTAGARETIDASIYLKVHLMQLAPITEEHFKRLRRKWERPDGKPLEEGNQVWRHARELALGFHYEWDPPPPEPWLEARREWSVFVRHVLSHSRTLDSPLQVVNAVDAGDYPEGEQALARWRAIRDSFKPNTVAIWHDDTTLKRCAEWAREPGIIWIEHTRFAERLAKETGLPFFGQSGYSADNVYVEDADPRKALIVSTRANKDGKNLQYKWHRNLVVSPFDGWDVWQQMIGRTHRDGQAADTVEVDVLWACREHIRAWERALSGTYAARDLTGSDDPHAYKLLLADVDLPSPAEMARLTGDRWRHM